MGQKHLFDALAQYQQTVKIRWHPFLLDNSIPSAGYEFRSYMQHRKGIEPQAIESLFDHVQNVGHAAGVKLDFNKIHLAVNTILCHQLIALAADDIKNDVVQAVYKAYFEDGLNLGDLDVVVAIGTKVGMDSTKLRLQLNDNALADRVLAESTFARLNGITSVPFYVINDKVKVNGSHSSEVFLQALNRAALLEISPKIW
ncbi:DsbA family oxidoreductase [Brasilonema sp. CT11]|nr:DsbA family oxidoreductase [Brasilonema sp. CT11]